MDGINMEVGGQGPTAWDRNAEYISNMTLWNFSEIDTKSRKPSSAKSITQKDGNSINSYSTFTS